MKTTIEIGSFDLDIQLSDEALDERNTPTRRMIANASIGVDPSDAYYSTRELREVVQEVHHGTPGGKKRLSSVLSTECDDYQRCLYFCLAGRGIVKIMDDLEWLEAVLRARAQVGGRTRRDGGHTIPLVNPYVSARPDGPLVSAISEFTEGPSWYLDPDLGGEIAE